MLLGLLDGALLVGLVIESGQCSTDCFAGVLLVLVAPTPRPLLMAGLGQGGEAVGVITTFVAVGVTAALMAWWWLLVARGAQWLSARHERRFSFWAVWAVAVAWTLGMTFAVLGLELRFGAAVSVAFELAAWTAALVAIRRVRGRFR